MEKRNLIIECGNSGAFVARGADELGLTLPHGAPEAFDAYYLFLEECGETLNLTSVTGAQDVARLHFLDSLALLKAAPFSGARVIDVGSGAGFPGVPIKIAEPSVDLTLLDATGKRVKFLSDLCMTLSLDVACICARAEEAAYKQELRGIFDIAVSRAVARLNILCELCLPFVRVGGVFIAMKGVDSAEELAQSRSAADSLGAKLEDCFDYSIPDTDITHRAVVLRKTSVTPEKYPRRFARIKKAPL